MSIFVPNKVYLRGILLHYFIQKKSAAEAHRILVQTYGDNALSDTTCRDWFRRFKNNDFELEDKERSGAPKKFQDKELEQLLDEDPSQTLSELGKILQVDESTVSKRLKGLGMIQNQGHWVPYELKPRDVERRFGTCELLLQRSPYNALNKAQFSYGLAEQSCTPCYLASCIPLFFPSAACSFLRHPALERSLNDQLSAIMSSGPAGPGLITSGFLPHGKGAVKEFSGWQEISDSGSKMFRNRRSASVRSLSKNCSPLGPVIAGGAKALSMPRQMFFLNGDELEPINNNRLIVPATPP
ncbi:MOS1T transposase, partial [Pseudoatta argentina]